MATAEVIPTQSVVERVASLPLVSSTYGLVSSVYSSTKDNHPYIKTVCEAAEQGVRTITSVALTTASPIIDKLEPQIAMANDLACKGLDKIEKTLPILQQPSEQIVSNAKDVVTTAKDVVTGTVSGAKGTVSDTLTSVVEKTRGAVHGGVDKTKAVVNGSMSTVLESRVARLISSGVDTALSTSESLVEQYLPMTEAELELEAKTVQSCDNKEPSYYVRLGSLSTKLRKRAYSRAVVQIRDSKQRCMEFISELNSTVDLIGVGGGSIGGAGRVVGGGLGSLVAWGSGGPGRGSCHGAEVVGSRALALARSLARRLRAACLVLVSGLRGLPGRVRRGALSLGRSASRVCVGFGGAGALGGLPDAVLAGGGVRLGGVGGSLDGVVDCLVGGAPLGWLVGPFCPRVAPGPAPVPASGGGGACAASSGSSARGRRGGPVGVEMESL